MKLEVYNFKKHVWEKADIPEITNVEEEERFIQDLGRFSMDYQESLIEIIDTMTYLRNNEIEMEKD